MMSAGKQQLQGPLAERSRLLNIFGAANRTIGSYDDFPVLNPGIDPMVYLSRNKVPQPFWLSSNKDQTILNLSGRCRIEFKDCEYNYMQLEPGDAVYLPAGIPNHLLPDGECLQLRFKAEPPGHEEISFYCQRCNHLVYNKSFDAGEEIAQQVYWETCQEYNRNQAIRTCQNCGEVSAPVDLTGIVWPQVVENIRKANEAYNARRGRNRSSR
jgi:3-hydroxyanthranilate 3,4-dioxygenase